MYFCKKVLASFPLGVLKSNSVAFTPGLPQQHKLAIQRLGMGLMNKVILSFSENFWGPVYWVSVGCDERGKYPHFYNFSQADKHILCCFLTDDFARKCELKEDEEIVREILELFGKMFP